MRYDLTDFEWSVIEPLLPTKRRGVKSKNCTEGANQTAASERDLGTNAICRES